MITATYYHGTTDPRDLKHDQHYHHYQDVQRLIPVDYTGDGNLPARVLDMSAIPTAAPMGGMMGMPPGLPSAKNEQDVGDQIKSEITVGGKKNKTHYGKKFGKKHKSAMLDFTKSLWMQDAAASLRNVLKSEVYILYRKFLIACRNTELSSGSTLPMTKLMYSICTTKGGVTRLMNFPFGG